MLNILTALACHFLGDFAFQSEYMAMNKGKNWEVLFYHCAVYVSLFALFGSTLLQLGVLLISHLIIDALKARYGYIKYIWQDQILHSLIVAVLFK